MGKFSEAFKLSERIKNADFSDVRTRRFWTDWAKEVIDKASRVNKMEVHPEQTKSLGDHIEKL